MKNLFIAGSMLLLSASAFSQVGIGTTSPNSTLDVRGSIALAYRSFSSSTSAATTDNTLVFTGTSAATLTLPDATTIAGRSYWIKNGSSNSSTLTIATTSSQTIDGNASWSLAQQNKAVNVVSNGTNWYISSESTPGSGAGSSWVYGGNSVPSIQSFGTSNSYDLPFITNNSEKMRITTSGNVGIGTSGFNGSNPEKLLVDAGTTSSFNVISGKGTIDNYLQLNIQNNSSGNSASSDVVATANNGNENINYIDMGINSSTYNNTSIPILNGANNAYIYTTGNDFILGNASNGRYMSFFTGGTAATNERMRILGTGLVGIGNTAPISMLEVGSGTSNATSAITTRSSTSVSSFTPATYANYNGGVIQSTYPAGSVGQILNLVASGSNSGNWPSAIAFWTRNNGGSNATQKMYINDAGNVGIGTSTFSGTAPEKLLVDAGTTSSYNVISGKGNINSYLQLNIQNNSNGASASSDMVATANNGNESINYVNLGINGGGNSSTGQLGGANTAYLYSTGNDFVIGNATNDAELRFFTTTGSTYTERMRIDGPTGNVGIGTNAPTAGRKLHVSGGDFRVTNNSINFDIQVGTTLSGHTNAAGVAYYEIGGAETHMFGGQVIPDADNVWTLGINGRRWSAVWSANGTIQTSDLRLKKNILPLNYGLNEVMQMEPVRYDWKDNSGSHKIGLIAQEVKRIVPEVVTGDENKESLGMNYAELVPVLINAVKELKADLENTKKELEELKKTIKK